jgi:hypothetical protein
VPRPRLTRWAVRATQGKGSYGASVDKEQLRAWEQELWSFVPPALTPNDGGE